MLDRQRLRRIGSGLGSQYVLLPGLAQFGEEILDKFEAAGIKLVRNRVTTLRLWLQLWDSQTGHIVWESSGEGTTASRVFEPKANRCPGADRKETVGSHDPGWFARTRRRKPRSIAGSVELRRPVRGVERIMRKRPRLRCQDLERCFQVLWRLRHQTSDAGHERQQEYRGRHEVEHAVNFKALPSGSHRSAGPAPSPARSPG